MRPIVLALLFAVATIPTLAQSPVQPDAPHRDWKASWITHPTAPLREPLVLHFRRTLDLASVPATYMVRVSADNRFILYVNGKRVGDGPARGDLAHWRYERFDLAPYLQQGPNLHHRYRLELRRLRSGCPDQRPHRLPARKRTCRCHRHQHPQGVARRRRTRPPTLARSTVTYKTYFASGPGEEIDASKYDWNWNSATPGPAWVPAASPMRDSIFAGCQSRPLRRHHRRQPLGPRSRRTAAHGVRADRS